MMKMDKKGENKDGDQSSDAQEEEDDGEEMNGVYIKAFCSGVNELLNVYKEHLLAIEHEYLIDRTLTISHLHQSLQLYLQMFPALISLMSEIESLSLKGGQLLEAL